MATDSCNLLCALPNTFWNLLEVNLTQPTYLPNSLAQCSPCNYKMGKGGQESTTVSSYHSHAGIWSSSLLVLLININKYKN